VAVYKPVQAGTNDGCGDIDEVRRLAGISDVHEGIRLADPMAPVVAATRANLALPHIREHADNVDRFVEGAGGLLVHLDFQGPSATPVVS
jgi:dethiobiotin synthetase